MTEQELFTRVGIRPQAPSGAEVKPKRGGSPWISLALLGIIVLGCLLAGVIAPGDPGYLDLLHGNQPPDREFLFGTDSLGRDLFACIWHGGRVSLTIGFLATAISTFLAVVYGTLSGMAPGWLDTILMRLTEILLSVPSLLLVIFILAILGEPTVLTISVTIGITSWFSIAKVIRTEVQQIRGSEYVVAARCMGGGFWYVLWQHLAPNFVSSIMFMVVMNIRGAITAESTLSFMGMGLPISVISWGSMLSLADRALMTRAWWVILVPGIFLVTLLMCLTNLGNWLRKNVNRKESNL